MNFKIVKFFIGHPLCLYLINSSILFLNQLNTGNCIFPNENMLKNNSLRVYFYDILERKKLRYRRVQINIKFYILYFI